MKSGDDGNKRKKKEGKDLLKKKITIVFFCCLLSFSLGGILGYYLNPKCGNFKTKTEYVLNRVQQFLKTEDPIQIVETPIEHDCPICIELSEQEEDTCPIRIDVSGAVRRPGVYCFEVGSVIQDAVDVANGFDAAYGYKYISRKINLAHELKDNQKIYFPFKSDLVCELQDFSPKVEKEEVITKSTEGVVEGTTTQDSSSDDTEDDINTGCVSINGGSKEELMTLSGVGESTAQKIIDGRPFETIEDILNVKGIGEASFEKIKDDICL